MQKDPIMKTKIFFFFTLSLLLVFPGFVYSMDYTLQDCIELAMENNVDLAVVENQLEIARMQIETRFIDVRETDLSNASLRLSLLELESQRNDLIDGITIAVYEKYYSCKVADLKEELHYSKKRLSEELLRKANAEFDLGNADINDVYEAQANYQQNRNDYLTAYNKQNRLYAEFRILLDLPLDTHMNLISDFPDRLYDIDYQRALEQMQENNLQWKIAELKAQVSNLEYEARLGTSGLSENQRQQLELTAESNELQRQKEHHDLEVKLQSAYFDVQEMESSLEYMQESVNLMRTQRRTMELMAVEGVVDRLTYQEVEHQYQQLRISYLELQMAYKITYLNYHNLWKEREANFTGELYE